VPNVDEGAEGRSASVPSANRGAKAVNAQAVLIDPRTMTVEWMNEAAAEAASRRGDAAGPSLTVGQVLPLASTLELPEALREVAQTGAPRHLRTDVVAMRRASVALVVSIYRLPAGKLLLIAEHAVQAGRGGPGGGASRLPGRPRGGVT
jgi:hypothetical protein